MKKLNLLLITLVLAALFLSSCKKDSNTSTSTNNNNTSTQASIEAKWKLTGGTTYDYLDYLYDSFTYYVTFSSNSTIVYDFNGKYMGMDVPYTETGNWGWLNSGHDSLWVQYSTNDTMTAYITTLTTSSLKFYDDQGETYELTK